MGWGAGLLTVAAKTGEGASKAWGESTKSKIEEEIEKRKMDALAKRMESLERVKHKFSQEDIKEKGLLESVQLKEKYGYDIGKIGKESEANIKEIQERQGLITARELTKQEEPMTADKARERLASLVKFESSLNRTGGWNETVFELMAKSNPDFAKSALTINSSKKEVRNTLEKLKTYYRSLIPEFQNEKSGEELTSENNLNIPDWRDL